MPVVERKHVLVLAFMPHGHLIATLELAKRISEFHFVTFGISKIVADKLAKTLTFSTDLDENIQLLSIDDGVTGNLEDAESFGKIFETIYPATRKLIEELPFSGDNGNKGSSRISRPIDAIVADNFFATSLTPCLERQIPFYLFNTPAARLLKFFNLIDENAPTVEMHQSDPFVRFPEPGQPLQGLNSLMQKMFFPIKRCTPYAKGIIQNSFRAIDKEDLEQLKNEPVMKGIPVYCVGPLIPAPQKTDTLDDSLERKVEAWMQKKAPRSVVYVSFGSVAVPHDAQIPEIAKAMLSLNKPFIWSLKEKVHNHLPEEIRSRIEGQFTSTEGQFLILPWAPQKAILSNPATAVIVSHCGWNGTLESLTAGVPIVAWPIFADQLLNADWLVDHGVALKISDTGAGLPGMGMKPKTIPADEIANAVAKVAGLRADNAGEKYAEAAQHWKAEIQKALSPTGSSTEELLEFVKSV
jgi:hypothetical protein